MTIIKQAGLLCLMVCLIYSGSATCNESDASRTKSMHAGFLHPNGVDLFGYSTEIQFSEHLYRYYTFGFPSLAAIGLNYYQSYTGDGVFASMGTGLGFLNQGNVSVGYQWQVLQKNQAPAYIKFGVGYAGSLVFNGAYPVISFEQRLP